MADFEEKPVGVGEWIVTFILSSLPIIGFVLLIVWAFDGNTKRSKKNWAIATLILIVVTIIIWIALIGSLSSFSGDLHNLMEDMFNR